tara:strand:- start:78 stop:242 length:165 start_codon:yes stop_codon:yes gene_type:complete
MELVVVEVVWDIMVVETEVLETAGLVVAVAEVLLPVVLVHQDRQEAELKEVLVE